MHDVGLQVAKTVNERISKYAQVTLESCAYAGTGNVLKVQQLLAQAGEHIELKEDESWKVRGEWCHTMLPHCQHRCARRSILHRTDFVVTHALKTAPRRLK